MIKKFPGTRGQNYDDHEFPILKQYSTGFPKLGRGVGVGAKIFSFESLTLTFSSLPKAYTSAVQSAYKASPHIRSSQKHVPIPIYSYASLGPFVGISMNLKPQGAPILKTEGVSFECITEVLQFQTWRCMNLKPQGAPILKTEGVWFECITEVLQFQTSRHMNSKPQCAPIVKPQDMWIQSLNVLQL